MSKTDNQITTGEGRAVYPRLTEPDYKFHPNEGLYSTKLHLTEEAYNELEAKVDRIVEQGYQVELAKQGKPKLNRATTSPLRITDEGQFEVYAKQVAKKQTAKGELTFNIPIYDSQGNIIQDPPNIGSGSILNLSCDVYCWYVPTSGFGYTLRLKGAQLIKLVEYSGGLSADNLGFKAVENGFVGETFDLDEESTENKEASTQSVPF